MAIFKKITFIFFFIFFRITIFSAENINHIYYLIKAGAEEKAISFYENYVRKKNMHDFDILQTLAINYLKKAAISSSAEENQLAMFGAGLATSSKSLSILEKGLNSNQLAVELTAIHFISLLQDSNADNLLIKAMSSKFIESRFEAAFQLAIKKHPCALGETLSLMHKLPTQLRPLFPQIFGIINNEDANRELKNFLLSNDPNLRIQTILTIANNNLDSFSTLLKKQLANTSVMEKESIIYCLSKLNSSIAKNEILKESNSSSDSVKIAACLALNRYRDPSQNLKLAHLAAKGNLFAIYALNDIAGAEKILYKFLKSPDKLERLNATLALLNKGSDLCINELLEIFSNTAQNYILPQYSIGKTLLFYKYINANTKNIDNIKDISLSIKQNILKNLLDINIDLFLDLSEKIFDSDMLDLVPYLTKLLSQIQNEKSINILKKNAIKTGSPLIRDYCNLALYKLLKKPIYLTYLKKWLYSNSSIQLIRLKPLEKGKLQYEKMQYELSKEDSAHFFMECLATLAENHTVAATMLILNTLKNTSTLNKAPVAGILLRATE